MNQERLFKVLLGPHITEKAASATGSATQVAFKVATDASKLEVKKAVEKLFEVKVEGVRVINVKGKTTEKLGVIGKEQAINWSLSGPMLRAAGVPWDLRKVDHYECYDDFEWEIAKRQYST